MPLRESEVAQCPFCEEYCRLDDLGAVTIGDGIVFGEPGVNEIPGDIWLGLCPECGADIHQSNVT